MGLLKNILKTLFFRTKKQQQEVKEYNPLTEEKEDFFCSKELIEKENKTDGVTAPDPQDDLVQSLNKEVEKEPNYEKAKSKRVRGFKNLTKEQEVLKYLLKNGSIDRFTCRDKFGLKRLDNYICDLRKQGMNIVNETIILHNEKGEKVKVNNYKLIS